MTDCDLRWEGIRVSKRCYKWAETADKPISEKRRTYASLTWDGIRYIIYRQFNAGTFGRVYIDDMNRMDSTQRQWEIESLQRNHDAAVLMGVYPGAFNRVDEILQDARSVVTRGPVDVINSAVCHAITAATKYGDYTVWIDVEHGFNIARVQIVRSRDRGHLYYDKPMRAKSSSFVLENVRFEQVQGTWVAMEADYTTQTVEEGRKTRVSTMKSHVKITEITLNPNHEAMRSFTGGDIPNGAEVFIVPVIHIRYIWTDGELVTKIDEDAVQRIDKIVNTLGTEKETGETVESRASTVEPVDEEGKPPKEPDKVNPRAMILPRPYCGVYCLYSMLRLMGRDVGLRELIKPEYVGSTQGSTMAELSQAAKDYGLFAGVAARLTTRGLSQCPYPAILHVKADFSHQDYDHYELFLGTEDGQAKLFDPPEGPRLVPFHELAVRWDGYALVLSDSSFVVDSIFGSDRQRLLLWAAVGTIALFVAHLLRSRLPISRYCGTRRRRMGLSVGQVVALGSMALVAGVVQHVISREGLVANAQATTSFQRAYRGSFIPRIGVRQVHKLLGSKTVLIDARYPEDYQVGHLKGAIGLPVDSNEAAWRRITAPIPKGSSVVVYCQSAGCKFAERVASQLVVDGFSDVLIFRGGWAEWTAKNGDPEAKRTRTREGVEPDGTLSEPNDDSNRPAGR